MAEWTIPGTNLVLKNVHDPSKCLGEKCVIHNPSNHHMRDWYLHWRDDRGLFERLCPTHGTGHPDPDQLDYWRILDMGWMAVHGCCGCCKDPGASVPVTEDVQGPSESGHAVLSLPQGL